MRSHVCVVPALSASFESNCSLHFPPQQVCLFLDGRRPPLELVSQTHSTFELFSCILEVFLLCFKAISFCRFEAGLTLLPLPGLFRGGGGAEAKGVREAAVDLSLVAAQVLTLQVILW